MAVDIPLMCHRCETRPRRAVHANTKYCDQCRLELVRQPRSGVPPAQAAQIAQLAGTMFRHEIAAAVGVSVAAVTRYLRETDLRSNARDYPREIVEAVCATYGALGKGKTQEAFPDICIRSITDRYYEGQPRQVRWQSEEILEAVRMAGLVSLNAQARWFNRPGAYNGAMTSLWTKYFHCAPGTVHGLTMWNAWALCRAGVVATLVHQSNRPGPRSLVLWLDMVGHLRDDVEPWVREALTVLAAFQAWIFGGKSSNDIRTMITERETAYGHESTPTHERHDAGDCPGATGPPTGNI